VVHVCSAHRCACLDIGSGEPSGVSEANELFHIVVTASSLLRRRRSAESGLRVGIDADETHTESSLVCVDLVVLVDADTRAPACRVLVGKLTQRYDTTVVTLGSGGIERRQLETRLRDLYDLVWDAIALKTRDDAVRAVG